MSFPLLANTVARAFPQGLDPDELERQRRIKRAASTQLGGVDDLVDGGDSQPRAVPPSGIIAPEARLYGDGPQRVTFRDAPVSPEPSIARAAPVVDVSRPVDRQHVDFSQPNPMDALAAQKAGASAQPFAADVDEGPATRRAREMGAAGAEPHQHGSGLGERLMHGLKLGGTALLRSGFNPLIAAGEFAEGAIDPNAWHRYEFGRDYPRAVAAAHNEQGMQEADLQRQLQRAGVTGELPSGAPTLGYREFQQRQDALNQQKEWQRYYQGEQLKDKAIGRDIQRGKFDWQKEYQGKRLEQHQQGLDNGSHQLVKGMTGDGKVGWFSVNKADSTDVVQVADADGKPLETPDAMLEGGRNYRAAQAQAHADSRAANAQAGANQRATMRGAGSGRRTHAQAEIEAAAALGADKNGTLPNPKWQTIYDEAYETWSHTPYITEEEARKMSEARANRVVKDGKRIPANKHPQFHMKVQELMGGQAGNASDPRIGKTFKDKSGKSYRITGIDADGQPIGVPIQ